MQRTINRMLRLHDYKLILTQHNINHILYMYVHCYLGWCFNSITSPNIMSIEHVLA